uniref:HTH psq-type domain-containing protein n=1 Tax=Cacopsylla melanoneura TaxID=428564 RepID=A0A8D8Y5H9_9HEMI
MPRQYTRTSNRKSWTHHQLASALKAIRDGCSIRGAGKQFNVPEATLRLRMKKEPWFPVTRFQEPDTAAASVAVPAAAAASVAECKRLEVIMIGKSLLYFTLCEI